MILAKELTKTFVDKKGKSVEAVKGVSFEAKPGEIFGLLGPNGAGKTTTLRMLATILEPTSGTATIAGHDIRTDGQQVRAKIGYLTGGAALYERLTATEVVHYFGSLFGIDEMELRRRIKVIFDELDMHEFADRRCDKLSTGQKQRVSIARAIIHEPQVLFFDEPTSGLDVVTSRTIIKFIKRCRDEGKTVVFSTHIMSEVEALCDRIAVVYDGKVAAIGTLQELRDQTGEQVFESVFLKLIGHGDDSE